MTKKSLFLLFFIPFFSVAQEYLFNGEPTPLLYKGYTNSFVINTDQKIKDTGTPLCFDGTVKITPNQSITEKPKYYIEVLDTVGRQKGRINISKQLNHPDGFQEKVFIDKFHFSILPFPETVVFIGSAMSGEKIETDQMFVQCLDFPGGFWGSGGV